MSAKSSSSKKAKCGIFTSATIQVDQKADDKYSWKLWNVDNIRFSMPVERTDAGGTWPCCDIKYEYGTKEVSNIMTMKLQLPDMLSYYGVSANYEEKHKNEVAELRKAGTPEDEWPFEPNGFSITCLVDETREDHRRVKEIFHELYLAMVKFLAQPEIKALIGKAAHIRDKHLDRLNSENLAPGTTYTLYYKKKAAKSMINASGARPMVTAKVTTGSYRSIFTNDNFKKPREFPLEHLRKFGFEHMPLIAFRDIYAGANGIKIRSSVASSVVIGWCSRTNSTEQTQVLKERSLARLNNDEATVEEQLAQLTCLDLDGVDHSGSVRDSAPPLSEEEIAILELQGRSSASSSSSVRSEITPLPSKAGASSSSKDRKKAASKKTKSKATSSKKKDVSIDDVVDGSDNDVDFGDDSEDDLH